MSRQRLASHGYTVVKHALPRPLLDAFTSTLSHLIVQEAARRSDALHQQVRAIAPARLPHDGLIALRNHDPDAMRRVVDSMKISAQFFAVIYARELAELAREYLDVPTTAEVLMSHPNYRADLPDDYAEEKRKFALPWHQESAYYIEKVSRTKALVLHISLFDCAAEHGALEVKEASHQQDRVAHAEYFMDAQAKKHFRVEVSEEALSGFSTAALVSEAGDVGVINFNLFHRSGQNTSDQVRHTFLIRVSPANAPDLNV